MTKAIAVQAVFLIGVIAIFLFFIVAIFWGWIGTTEFSTSQATCTAKKMNYCSKLLNDQPPPFDWDKKEPTDCSNFGITKPSKADC